MTTPWRCRTAYLVSKYPDVSHTFILREVLALRERGIAIDVASINAAPPPAQLTGLERREAQTTFYVKPQGALGALRGLLWAVSKTPRGVLRGLTFCLQLSRGEPRRAMLHLAYLAEALILGRWMEQRGLTHVHVHFATPAATVALLLNRVTKVSFSLTVHGPDEFFDVERYALKQKLTSARFAIAISYFAQSQMMKLTAPECWSKFEISRLGVDSTQFQPRSFRKDPSPFRVLCVGRLVAAKGQRILLEAVAQLRNQGRDVQLRLVGGGPDRASLEQAAAALRLGKAVEFAGAVNQDHIRAFYESADAFALASFAEGIPVVLMEAMAMGIPCVATSIAGIGELIHDGVDGLLVAPSNVEGLATALAQLMDSADLRRRLGQAGRQRVQRDYELSVSADALAKLLQRRLGADA
jgi:colanic acid/amylovoran biosynthesis glycosyltransferase